MSMDTWGQSAAVLAACAVRTFAAEKRIGYSYARFPEVGTDIRRAEGMSHADLFRHFF